MIYKSFSSELIILHFSMSSFILSLKLSESLSRRRHLHRLWHMHQAAFEERCRASDILRQGQRSWGELFYSDIYRGWEQFVHHQGADCVLTEGVVWAFLYEAWFGLVSSVYSWAFQLEACSLSNAWNVLITKFLFSGRGWLRILEQELLDAA